MRARMNLDEAASLTFAQEAVVVPDYAGRDVEVVVVDGFATVNGRERYVCDFLPSNTVLQCRIVRASIPALLVYDMSQFGNQSVAHVAYGSRLELLNTILPSSDKDAVVKMFGTRQVAPGVYMVSTDNTAADIGEVEDPRLVGSIIRDLSSLDHSGQILVSKEKAKRGDVDSVALFPPVPNEGQRVMAYAGMVRQNINKMRGKWRDVSNSSHSPGLLPFDVDDLMQFGLYQVMIALRKYDPSNPAKAQEHTFVFAHLYHRFGHLVTKYSKASHGYGARVLRDFTNEDGELTSVFDIIEGASK